VIEVIEVNEAEEGNKKGRDQLLWGGLRWVAFELLSSMDCIIALPLFSLVFLSFSAYCRFEGEAVVVWSGVVCFGFVFFFLFHMGWGLGVFLFCIAMIRALQRAC